MQSDGVAISAKKMYDNLPMEYKNQNRPGNTSILDALFVPRAETSKEDRIVLKNPRSKFNLFKRILAFLTGSLIIYVFTMAYIQSPDKSLSSNIQNFIFMAVFGFGFIYYAFLYNKIHKECFIEFHQDKIVARIPAPLENYAQNRALLLELMLSPEFIEFSYKYTDIKEIEIDLTKIIIHRKNGLSREIDLSRFDYNKLKAIKNKFGEIQNRISAHNQQAL